MATAGYLRAAYAQAIHDLGGEYRGATFPRGEVEGFANKAKIGKLVAQLVTVVSEQNESKARGAEQIGLIAINKAIDFVTEDLLIYAKRKLEQAGRL